MPPSRVPTCHKSRGRWERQTGPKGTSTGAETWMSSMTDDLKEFSIAQHIGLLPAFSAMVVSAGSLASRTGYQDK
jgi:hypothetical protein